MKTTNTEPRARMNFVTANRYLRGIAASEEAASTDIAHAQKWQPDRHLPAPPEKTLITPPREQPVSTDR